MIRFALFATPCTYTWVIYLPGDPSLLLAPPLSHGLSSALKPPPSSLYLCCILRSSRIYLFLSPLVDLAPVSVDLGSAAVRWTTPLTSPEFAESLCLVTTRPRSISPQLYPPWAVEILAKSRPRRFRARSKFILRCSDTLGSLNSFFCDFPGASPLAFVVC